MGIGPFVLAYKIGEAGPFAPDDVTIRFHLHPGVAAREAGDGAILLTLAGGESWRFEAGPVAGRIEESVFFAANEPIRTRQILVETKARETPRVHWRLSRLGGPRA